MAKDNAKQVRKISQLSLLLVLMCVLLWLICFQPFTVHIRRAEAVRQQLLDVWSASEPFSGLRVATTTDGQLQVEGRLPGRDLLDRVISDVKAARPPDTVNIEITCGTSTAGQEIACRVYPNGRVEWKGEN